MGIRADSNARKASRGVFSLELSFFKVQLACGLHCGTRRRQARVWCWRGLLTTASRIDFPGEVNRIRTQAVAADHILGDQVLNAHRGNTETGLFNDG